MITSIYNTNAVVMALATTAGIVVGLTFFACQTKYDFTGHGGYLFAAIWSFFIFGIIASIMFYRSDPETRRVVNYVRWTETTTLRGDRNRRDNCFDFYRECREVD